MKTRRPILAILLATLWLFAGPVAAQDLSRDEIREYRRLASESAENYAAGEYERALEQLLEARAIYPHRDIIYNIGLAQLQLQHCRDARTTFDSFVKRDDISDDERQAGEAQLSLAASCREVVELRVTCSPTNADVRIAEEPTECGALVQIDEGTHRAMATADGYRSWASQIDISPGQQTIVIDLEPLPEPEPPAPAPVNWRRPAAFAALGVGGAAIVAAFAIDAGATVRARRLAEAENTTEFEEIQQTGRRSRTAATVLYVGGVAIAAGGAVLLGVDLLGGRATVGVTPGPDGAALQLMLRAPRRTVVQ